MSDKLKIRLLFFFLLFSSLVFAQNKINLEITSGGKLSEKTYEKIALEKPLNIKDSSFVDSLKARIDNKLRDLGYFFSEIKIDSIRYSKDSSSVFVKLNIDEKEQCETKSLNIIADTPQDSAFVYNKLSFVIGSPFVPVLLKKTFSEILARYENNGFPFAKIKIQSIKWINENDSTKSVELFIAFRNGRTSIIDTIIVKGNKQTKDYVIIRNSGIKIGDRYSREKIKEAVANLARLGFFKKIKMPKFYYKNDKIGVLEFYVEEKSTNSFDGIIGYIPKRNDIPGYFTGYAKIDLRNIFGTERAFGFEWKKLDRFSQYFNVNYKEPWLFSFPLNLKLEVTQRKQDTTYIQRKYGAAFEYLATAKLKASLLYSYEETIPLGGFTATLNHSVFNTSGVRFYYDARDDIFIPTYGYLINLTLKYSLKNIITDTETENAKDNQYRIETDALGFLRIYKNNIAALGLHFRNVVGNLLEISDLYRFGGTNTLRGFNEDIFSGNVVAWSNLEYRFLLSPQSFLFAFFDSGYYYNDILKKQNSDLFEKLTFGYGGGISFSTGIGVMKVSFALAQGDGFSQGKIHFGISNGF